MLQIRVIVFSLILTVSVFALDNKLPLRWSLDDALGEDEIALDSSRIFFPDDIKKALELYESGNYRKASFILSDILELKLPDSNNDFVAFLLAESYRQLNMNEKAIALYRKIIAVYKDSYYYAASYYRLLLYEYTNRNYYFADSALSVFKGSFLKHPLYNSVLYMSAKSCYMTQRYSESEALFLSISPNSYYYNKARFFAAIVSVILGNMDRALILLNEIVRKSTDIELVAYANALIGDIYVDKGKFELAEEFYSQVKKKNEAYQYTIIKMASLLLKERKFNATISIARSFLNNVTNDSHFFEMSSILEKAYEAKRDVGKLEKLKSRIIKKNLETQLTFDITSELSILYDMIREWYKILYKSEVSGDKGTVLLAKNSIEKLQKLINKHRKLLYSIGSIESYQLPVSGLSQTRYIALLKKRVDKLRDTLNSESDTLTKKILSERLAKLSRKYNKIKSIYINSANSVEFYGKEMQVKYIDWAFTNYLQQKKKIKEILETNSSAEKSSSVDSSDINSSKTSVVATVDTVSVKMQEKLLRSNRASLIEHIRNLMDETSTLNYNAQIYFRLAELYYDEASDKFEKDLSDYETSVSKNDTLGLQFPIFDLSKVVQTYRKIVAKYSKDDIADDALYYMGMALKKMGEDDSANSVFEELVEQYPESEYYVEANMNIGDYYFANPKAQNGKGYQIAEEAFRKVLYFRDHPQFIPAVYRLGWCYYMQDKYDDAIAVFKYLIEEGRLSFSSEQNSEDSAQVINPLLREEAIDYIAISFDENGNTEKAADFLELVGNIDYAARVYMRIAKLREEDLDYTAAVKIYRDIIHKYMMSKWAPKAALAMIKTLEISNNEADALSERDLFLKRFGKGSKWYEKMEKRYPKYVNSVDSMVVRTALYVADTYYRKAEETSDSTLYLRAAKKYSKLSKLYSSAPIAQDALWNLAVILDTKLNRKKIAFAKYMAFSNMMTADSSKRRQAALNAIAIAQEISDSEPSDSSSVIGVGGAKLVEASENYLRLFPNGKNMPEVVINMGNLFFNRRMYQKAIDVYGKVKEETNPKAYFDASLLTAKSYFALENWPQAIKYFRSVWLDSSDSLQKADAFSMLLQSEFLFAKQLFKNKEYKKAAIAFTDIDTKYPVSEYSDKALFNAAEAFESDSSLQDACNTYYTIYEKYHDSPLVPDALFNAATNYEKLKDYRNASKMYETIFSDYIDSPKAKDALFNLSFVYEKLKEPDKVANANERYAKYFPGEKDVEAMLLRSANYYLENKQYPKAIQIFNNFIGRYSQKPSAVEAQYKIALSHLYNGDTVSAINEFQKTISYNQKLKTANAKLSNDYFAAEAAFELAELKRIEANSISLNIRDEATLKKSKKKKGSLIVEATKLYTKVILLKSKRMFEAGYMIGKMYEDFTNDWLKQDFSYLDDIKMAVAEKSKYIGASKLILKSLEPYKKVLELASKVDSLGPEEKLWVSNSFEGIVGAYVKSGIYMEKAPFFMINSPIPKKIISQPLYLFQYKQKLIEAVEPILIMARDNWLGIYDNLSNMKNTEGEAQKAAEHFAKMAYLIGNNYDSLAKDIVVASNNIPKKMSDDEREELQFQFEDMTFDLQDNALQRFKDALSLLKNEKMTKTKGYNKILSKLAELDPDNYGKDFYSSIVYKTDYSSIYNADSVRYWTEIDPFNEGWKQVKEIDVQKSNAITESGGKYVWSANSSLSKIYIWSDAYIDGIPKLAKISYSSVGPFKIFLNGKLLSSDTATDRKSYKVSSLSNITSYINGGDNIIAFESQKSSTGEYGAAFIFEAMMDSSRHFASAANPPNVTIVNPKENIDTSTTLNATDTLLQDTTSKKITQKEVINEFKNRGELRNAIGNFMAKKIEFEKKIKIEDNLFQNAKADLEQTVTKIKMIKSEIDSLNNAIESMRRKK